MKKLIIALLFAAFLPHAALAVSGPAQWSLAGVASWAQPLTASGTALPATSTYAIGDLFALYGGAASTTFELYRLCASGTDAVWLPSSGEGGGTSTLIDATDLPSVTGNANKVLALGTDTVAFWWSNVIADLASHISDSESPHGPTMYFQSLHLTTNAEVGDIYIRGGDYDGLMSVAMESEGTIDKPGLVLIASYSASGDDTYAHLAPASSTMAMGISLVAESGGWCDVAFTGECMVIIASDSDPVAPGDWLITSDTTPGHVMRASVAGDAILPYEEKQRCVGYSTYAEFYSEFYTATYTRILLKGNR